MNQIKEIQGTENLIKALSCIRPPQTEEEVYRSWMEHQLWSIDEFSALIGGLTPENYKNGTQGTTEIPYAVFIKKETFSTKVFT